MLKNRMGMRVAVLGAMAGLLAGCGGGRTLVVGSKSTAEQALLGEIVAQHLERSLKVKVERRLAIGNTQATHQALMSGEIELYPEYTSAAYAEILKLPPLADEAIVRERLKDEFRNRLQLLWLPPLGFSNTYLIAVRSKDAPEMKTLTDAESREGWRMGVTSDFEQRQDGYAAMMTTYKLQQKAAPRSMPAAQIYGALQDNQVDLISGTNSDGMLQSGTFRILADDKKAFLHSEAAILVRAETLAARPGLEAALGALSGKISDETMRSLNYEVQGKRRTPADVAAEFLKRL